MNLDRLLSPRSVAVIGATDRVGSYARATLDNLREGRFAGSVVGVHPTRRDVLGVSCVPTLADLDCAVDAVVIATPAATVAAQVRVAREMQCGGAIVYAAGFAESGEHELQNELVRAAAGFPVIGPNGNGVVSVHARAALWGDDVRLPEVAGSIALVTQSGNVGVVSLAHRQGLGLHTVVSLGNAAVVDAAAVIAQLAGTDGVRVIAMYAEADGDGARLCEALALCAENDVRLVVLKAGRSAQGAAAGAAHTSVLAGDHRVYAALMREAGAVMVREPVELLETARALSLGVRDSRGIGVVTCSGGDSVMAADIADDVRAHIATLTGDTLDSLRALLPDTATAMNPLDHTNTVWADTEAVAALTELVARDPDVAQIVYVQDQPPELPPHAADEWTATREGALLGGSRAGIPTVVVSTAAGQSPPGAVAGLVPLMQAIAALQSPAPSAHRLRSIAAAAHSVVTATGGDVLPEHEGAALLSDSGVDVASSMVATTPADAREAAAALGLPVVLKVSAPGLLHVSDIGGVVLGLSDLRDVEEAATRLLELPGLPERATLMVQQMIPAGVEMLVSVHSDGVVPVLVIGRGGTWAESSDDVVVVPLPVDESTVERAIDGLRCRDELRGARGTQAYDIDALCQLAVGASRLVTEGTVSLVELNPVIVTTDGAVAVDAVILL